MTGDLYDRLEARHEAHERAAREMAAVLGVGKDADDADKPRDDKGQFVGSSLGSADAGERGAPVMPRPTMGHLILAHLEDDRSYLDRA
jgi:hypothetical protein